MGFRSGALWARCGGFDLTKDYSDTYTMQKALQVTQSTDVRQVLQVTHVKPNRLLKRGV